MKENKQSRTLEDALQDFESNAWINDAFEVVVGKEDPTTGRKGDLYIKVKKTFVAKEGASLRLKSRDEQLKDLVEKGFISKDQAKERKEKTPWITYVGTVPPQNKDGK